MKSETTAEQVALHLNLIDDPRFGAGEASPDTQLSRLIRIPLDLFHSISSDHRRDEKGFNADASAIAARNLQRITSISRRGLTNLIAISVTIDDPKDAARLANAYAHTYIDDQFRSKLQLAEQNETALANRVSELEEALRQSEAQIRVFVMAQAAQPGNELKRQNLDRLQANIATAAQDANSRITRLQEIDRLLTSGDYLSLGQALNAPEIILLDEQRRTLVQRLRNSQPEAGRETEVQKTKMLASQLQSMAIERVSSLRREAETSSRRLEGLQNELAQALRDSGSSTSATAELFRLQQEAAATRQLYQDYLARLKAAAQRRKIVTPNASVIAEATVPPVKSFPPRLTLIILGSGAGLALAIGIGYARDNFPPNIKLVGELEAASHVKNACIVPYARDTQRVGERGPANKVCDFPLSGYSEAIRKLRISLDLTVNKGAGFSSLLVTSTSRREGRSTIALSLARSAALAGLKVALVDCDLRYPSLHSRLDLDNSNGVVEALRSKADCASLIKVDPKSTCSLITTGETEDIVPDRLLQPLRVRTFIRELEEQFELVIFDTVPIGMAVDPLLLAPYVDAVLLVTRWARTRPASVRSAIQELSSVKSNNLFTVLNFADPRES